MPDPEQEVVDALHRYTKICNGADTCAAREILEPLLAERDRLRADLEDALGAQRAITEEANRLRGSLFAVRAMIEPTNPCHDGMREALLDALGPVAGSSSEPA